MVRLIALFAVMIGLVARSVPAAVPEWAPTQVYSNADGSVQFAVLWAYDGGQQFLGGYPLVVRTLDSSAQRAFIYPNDLPGDSFRRGFLVATQGFADLHVLTPDYVVPNAFFPVQGGIICVTEASLSCYMYPALPTDGVRAFWQDPDFVSWYAVAVPTNFAGESYSFAATAPTPSQPPPSAPPPPSNRFTPSVSVIEYYHAGFDHYFITAIPDEIVKLDNGAFAGWQRTGLTFNAYREPVSGTSPVCRFVSTAFGLKSSHFLSPFADECATVRRNADWALEGDDVFLVYVANPDGSCGGGYTPVHRLYNNGQGGAPNHRYTIDTTVRAQMIVQGWVAEGIGPDGVQMCSAP